MDLGYEPVSYIVLVGHRDGLTLVVMFSSSLLWVAGFFIADTNKYFDGI